MSRITTYTCDRCSKTVEQNHLLCIELRLTDNLGVNEYAPRVKAEWCRTCINEFRLIRSTPPKEGRPTPPPPPSLEDIVREICREEIEDHKES